MDDPFNPPGVAWQPVSPRLAVVRRSLLAVVLAVLGAVIVLVKVTGLVPPGPVWVAAGVLFMVACWAWWLIGRNAHRWRYAETDDELLVTSGALFRRLVAVPYGRLQYVDVQAGPFDQLAGIAAVQVHTASPATSAVIPGLPAAEAARLRDRLTVSGDSTTAGL